MRITVLPFAHQPSGLVCAIVLLALTPTAIAQGQIEDIVARAGIETMAPGQSDGRLKSQMTNAIPWNQMDRMWQAEVRQVLDDCAQYRRLPEVRYSVAPPVYQYLVRHPDVAVSTWRAMSISQVEMWQTGPLDYEGQAPDGSQGVAHIVYQDDSQCLLLCKGTYSNPLLPRPITAAALLWMRYDFRPLPNGEQQVHQQTDVFLSFPSAAARTVALVASPVTNMMMDRNLFEISLYARMMSQAAVRDPEWFEQLAAQLDGVLPQRRQELAALAVHPTGRPVAATPAVAQPGAAMPLRAAGRAMPMMAPQSQHPSTLHMYRPSVQPVPATAVPAIPAANRQPRRITRTAANADEVRSPEAANPLSTGDSNHIPPQKTAGDGDADWTSPPASVESPADSPFVDQGSPRASRSEKGRWKASRQAAARNPL